MASILLLMRRPPQKKEAALGTANHKVSRVDCTRGHQDCTTSPNGLRVGVTIVFVDGIRSREQQAPSHQSHNGCAPLDPHLHLQNFLGHSAWPYQSQPWTPWNSGPTPASSSRPPLAPCRSNAAIAIGLQEHDLQELHEGTPPWSSSGVSARKSCSFHGPVQSQQRCPRRELFRFRCCRFECPSWLTASLLLIFQHSKHHNRPPIHSQPLNEWQRAAPPFASWWWRLQRRSSSPGRFVHKSQCHRQCLRRLSLTLRAIFNWLRSHKDLLRSFTGISKTTRVSPYVNGFCRIFCCKSQQALWKGPQVSVRR